jgi:hypothetical protein
MSTAATLDATIARAPDRRPSSSFGPRTAESSHRYVRTLAKIFAMSAAVVALVAALLSVHIDNPSTNVRGCTYAANQHISRLSIERDWHTDGLPILREPAGTDWIATGNCPGQF